MDTPYHSYKRQMDNKDNHTATDIKDMSLVLNKPYVAYIFKKTQKISQAIFLVTNSFDQAESLKNSLRQNAGLLITEGVEFLKSDSKDKMRISNSLISSLLGTLSFCEAAHYIGLISEMNFSILKEEINALMQTIESQKEGGLVLSRAFMDAGNPEDYKRQSDAYKGHINVLNIPPTPVRVPSNNALAATPVRPKEKAAPAEDKSERSKVIISLLNGGKELTIKDITSHLKGISEKTVQRELLSLVAQGILKKKGERRWSRYSL